MHLCLEIHAMRAVASLMLLLCCLAGAQVPMGPGTMAPYSGGGGRQRGFGYVREPAKGFFIAGSTLRDMNGVYAKVDNVPARLAHKFQLAYRKWPIGEPDHLDGWMIALVDSPADPAVAGYTAVGGKKSEWVIIDSSGRDRFGHEGETVIPGAGARWQHLHRATVEERNAGGGSSSGAPEAESQLATSDDEDELPWQVIFIGDENMVERLRRGHRYYEHNIQQAIGGGTCEGRPGGCAEEECPFTMPSVPEADDAFEQGDFAEAAQHYAAAIASACPDCPRDGEYRKFPKWREATLRVLQARSLRRAHLLDQALDVLNPVLSMLPRYKEAWLEMGKLMLDVGRPDAALSAFENILKFDRDYPVLPYLVRAKANIERAHVALKQPQSLTENLISDGRRIPSLPSFSEHESEALDSALARASIQRPAHTLPAADHYSMLGVSSEFSPEELKKAYKKMSRVTHPDKNGGSTTRFQAVAAAYETLSDADRREAYDAGSDVKRDLMSDGSEGPTFWDKVRKEYFPEQFGYEPFGDPYEHKRDFLERRRQEKPPVPNGADIPVGSYQHTCRGCSMLGAGRLWCTHCPNGRGQRLESSIAIKDCADAEWIGNHAGKLVCEARPQQALPPQDAEPPADADTGGGADGKAEL